jgi:hypothetical protein
LRYPDSPRVEISSKGKSGITYETNLEAFVGTHDLPLQPRTADKRDDHVMADEVMESYEAKVLK